MKALLALPLVAALGVSACDRAREVATRVGISKDAQDFCEQLFASAIPGRDAPVDAPAIQVGLQGAGAACLLEVVRDFGTRRVEVVAVDAPPSLAGELVTAEAAVAADVEEAVLVSDDTAADLTPVE